MTMPAQHTVRRLMRVRAALEILLALAAAALLVFVARQQAREAAQGKHLQPVRQAIAQVERSRHTNNEHNSLQATLEDETQVWVSMNKWLFDHAPHSGHCILNRQADLATREDPQTPTHTFKLVCEGYGKQMFASDTKSLQGLQVFDTKLPGPLAGRQARRQPKNKVEEPNAINTRTFSEPTAPTPEGWLTGPRHHHVFNVEARRWEIK